MHGLEAEYWERVDFVYIDRDDPLNAELLTHYEFVYQPYFVFVQPDGAVIERFVLFDPNAVRLMLDTYLSQQAAA